MAVFAVYVEKKSGFAEEAEALAADLRLGLQIAAITSLRIINRYFVEGITEGDFDAVKSTVFSEPPVDIVYDELPAFAGGGQARLLAVEYLSGQFDQRADSAAQCISLALGKEKPVVRTAKIYIVYGGLSDDGWRRLKSWLVNPVESREASLDTPATLIEKYPEPRDTEILNGFLSYGQNEMEELCEERGIAMDVSDLRFCQDYFRGREKRAPSLTELRVLDTYWSDHCRHTTFLTELDGITIDSVPVRESYERYLELRRSLGRENKPVTLMDIATIGAAALKARGKLPALDESEEINACSVKITVDVNGTAQDWLLMFKNETHNHPTEIEPFGGAATCLGGAIRDPLSGRAFVYQAMRITGAADPLQKAESAIPGKLPQRKICRTAAAGFSSYGNQIGLATGIVHEIYHPGYAAKRMEVGAVIGAVPAENVVRKKPSGGDLVILLGGRTGRDGCGGATGSSKSHTETSLENCGAEVQKGNAPEERKLQRLFRDPRASCLIKRCNDFGAGGVSVSVGELADGLEIDLDKILKKYEGLDGTELAISESQERMSVVVDAADAEAFIALAARENLEAVVIARVTGEQRLVMKWKGKTIVDLSRELLDSNGARKHAKARVPASGEQAEPEDGRIIKSTEDLEKLIAGLDICSQKGLASRFDSVVGAGTVVMPFGGKYQLTPAQSMAAKIPVLGGDTGTCSLMSWGFDPFISSVNPYHGAIYAVVSSIAKVIASGGSRKGTFLSFQEYFERLKDESERWGKPLAALLGALEAQIGLETAAIGGKDSMSGSFTSSSGAEINVPPTLISFAVSTARLENIITPEFKRSGSFVYRLKPPFALYEKADFQPLRGYFDVIENLNASGKILSSWAVGPGGTAEAVVKMCMGNHLGFEARIPLARGSGFGGFVVETDGPLEKSGAIGLELLGRTIGEYALKTAEFEIDLEKIQNCWESALEPVYPCLVKQDGKAELFTYNAENGAKNGAWHHVRPTLVIPVFPGTNSEYDTARAIEKAGCAAETFVIRNVTPASIAESVRDFVKIVSSAQGIVIPGGFSGGDEPDGSGKFITAFFRSPAVSAAVQDLLQKRDGLMCGICNGFQALVKLGLVPYGEIRAMTEKSPTLTFNKIGRHQSVLVRTRIVSNKSPWLSHLELGGIYIVPVSHGEGRFVADEALVRGLAANGQIATQYTDFDGNASQDIRFNPNNSDFAIEGITSPDGRVFGRMAHNERFEAGLFRNIPGVKEMDIFAGAAAYFR